ncbi:MAG: adenylate/guanylate cyclase domain-containing protein, partial [Actinomycetota bacterium]|nr:adenylate/guanylate cyclase domain-containing protein [Actinomycetota bacterium]
MLARVRRDEPGAYVPEDRRQALALGEDLPTRCSGAALFADVSGFTALTEALVGALGRRYGADALTEVLDRVFDALLDRVREWGGSTLYFSGDAVTCWFDGDDGSRALSCAHAVQDAVAQEGLVTAPGGGEVQLRVKVAVAVGHARRFLVGDPSLQLIDVLAGALLDRLAAAEQAARPGEVLLDPRAAAALAARVRLGAPRPSGARPVEALLVPAHPPALRPVPRLDPAVVRPWLLPPVLARLADGGDLLAELRPAVPVFVRFGGLDHDRDTAAQALDDFVVQVQRAFAAVGGNVLQLSVGDKGAYLYAVVGSPVAHEDAAARACAAALEVVALEARGGVQDIQVGVASGLTRSGTYGSADRRTFCCLGAPVNLAARLMVSALPGTVCVSEAVAQAAGDGFAWEGLEPARVKGMSDPVSRRRLVARRRRIRSTTSGPLLGRAVELGRLLTRGSGAV